MGKVEMIGRGDMHHIDTGVSQHLLGGAVRLRYVHLPGFLCGPLGAVPGNRGHIDAQSSKRLHMRWPDEARTDDTYSPSCVCHGSPPIEDQSSRFKVVCACLFTLNLEL